MVDKKLNSVDLILTRQRSREELKFQAWKGFLSFEGAGAGVPEYQDLHDFLSFSA